MPIATDTILTSCTITSPLGDLDLVWSARGLLAVEFADHHDRVELFLKRNGRSVRSTQASTSNIYVAAINRYFDGHVQAVARLPVELLGAPFQLTVWNALRDIPPGETRSYGEIAAAIGKPGAARAVGAANGQNPIGIVVPCHRVIGSNGKLTGYAGGLDRKRWLLEHEGALAARPAPVSTDVAAAVQPQLF